MKAKLTEVAASKLIPGKWYWWIIEHPIPNEPHHFDKFCVVRCFKEKFDDGQTRVCVNCSESLEEDNSFFVGVVSGRFYGPVPIPHVPRIPRLKS